MQAEFEAAVEDGKPFLFAIGCLAAALRSMVTQGEGRLVLTNYLLALGLLIPMAAMQFQQAIGLAMFIENGASQGMLADNVARNPYLIWSLNSAAPVLLTLSLLLGIAQLCLAWVLVEGNWSCVVKLGALIGAATLTLLLLSGVLMLALLPQVVHVAALGVELAAILFTARWHARVLAWASPRGHGL